MSPRSGAVLVGVAPVDVLPVDAARKVAAIATRKYMVSTPASASAHATAATIAR